MRVQVWPALAVAGALVAACSDPTSSEAAKTENPFTEGPIETGQPAEPNVKTPAQPVSNWSYQSNTDEMRGTTAHFATVSSENIISVGFPYDAENARLTIRRRASDGLSVMLNAPGQFLCRSYDDDTVAVKFDDGSIQHFTCSEPDDASTGMLFINSESRFVERLKKAKRLIIEAQMYQAGPQQMTFDVEGLEWPPKAEASS